MFYVLLETVKLTLNLCVYAFQLYKRLRIKICVVRLLIVLIILRIDRNS